MSMSDFVGKMLIKAVMVTKYSDHADLLWFYLTYIFSNRDYIQFDSNDSN